MGEVSWNSNILTQSTFQNGEERRQGLVFLMLPNINRVCNSLQDQHLVWFYCQLVLKGKLWARMPQLRCDLLVKVKKVIKGPSICSQPSKGEQSRVICLVRATRADSMPDFNLASENLTAYASLTMTNGNTTPREEPLGRAGAWRAPSLGLWY